MAKIRVLKAAELPPRTVDELRETFDLLALPKGPDAVALLEEEGATIRGIAARKTVIDSAFLDRVPAVEIIASYSAGLDGIDVAEVRRRGIAITNTSHVLAGDVADLALAFVLSLARRTLAGHRFVADGQWPGGAFALGRSMQSLRIGIVGLGHVGLAVAGRLAATGAALAYFGPNEKAVSYRYFPDLKAMAAWADMLVVTCPASPATFHLIDAEVLSLVGPDGYLVNVSRGNVVDELALVAALAAEQLAGAALDVFDTEPNVPEALRSSCRVVLSPHMGSGTRETRQQMGDSVVAALKAHFSIA